MLSSKLKQEMILEAKLKYYNITPCYKNKTFDEGFIVENFKVYFWFNDSINSTRLLTRNLKNKNLKKGKLLC